MSTIQMKYLLLVYYLFGICLSKYGQLNLLFLIQVKKRKDLAIKLPKLPRILSLALAGVGIVFLTFTFLFAGTTMKNSDAYKVAIKEIE